MTTHPCAANAAGLPEATPSVFALANEMSATAGDIRYLLETLASVLCNLTADASTQNYAVICQANAVARALEGLGKTLEVQSEQAFRVIGRAVRS